MGLKKIKFGKPSKSTSGMNFKVRFKMDGGHFVVTDKKRKVVSTVKYKNHDEAFVYANELNTKKNK